MRLDAVILLLFVCLFGSFKISAQTYNYTYTDPCTGNDQTIIVPINGNVTVGYYGAIGSFSYNDFTNGTFEAWASNIFSQYGTNSPCSEIVGLGTAVNVTQSTALNVIGILNSLTTISEIASGSTNILGGSVSSVSNSGGSGGSKKENKNNGNQSNSNNPEGSTNTGSNENSTQSQGNSTSNQGNGGGAQEGSGQNTTTSGSNANGNQQTGTSVNGGTSEQPQSTTGNTGSSEGNPPTGNQNTAGNTGSSEGNPPTGNQTNGQENGGNPQQNETASNPQGSNTEQQNTQEGTQSPNSEQTNNQTTNGESSGNNSNGNNGSTGTGGNGSGSGGTNGQNEEGQTTTPTEEEGKTNITAGASTTVKSTPTNKEGGKPTVVASADFVGFNFKNSDVKVGAKATGGYTAMRWDGKRSYGAMADYTSALKGPNITTFYAWVRPKSIILTSATLTIGFEGNKSLYGTFAAGQMFNIKKPKNLKLLYMGTVSYGSVYRESFLGTALIAGGMYDFRVGKRFDIKLMNLLVYAPYVSYYNDVVLKSPYVMLPSIGTNIRITKKFKFNINAGGAWDLKTSALNYTITCGTRMVVGQ